MRVVPSVVPFLYSLWIAGVVFQVARRGARYGMPAPMLVQFEQEIDALEQKIKRAEDRRNSEGGNATSDVMASSDTDSDRASLDEWVSSGSYLSSWLENPYMIG